MGKHGFGVRKASLSQLPFFSDKGVCVWPPGVHGMVGWRVWVGGT